MAVQEEVGLQVVAFCFVDLRLCIVSTGTSRTAELAYLLLHGIRRAEPMHKLDLLIVDKVLRLPYDILHA